MRDPATKDEVGEIKKELNRIREQSLAAARQNDFRTVARLTGEAARLNRALQLQGDLSGRTVGVMEALAGHSRPAQFGYSKFGSALRSQAV